MGNATRKGMKEGRRGNGETRLSSGRMDGGLVVETS